MAQKVRLGGELDPRTVEGIAADAKTIIDRKNGNKRQDDMNSELAEAIAAKQATLVSGTNIKTINNQSILGPGNIEIQDGGVQSDWNETDTTNPAYIKNKPIIPDVSGKADKIEMSVTPGTGANADKTTIQLKQGMSATVLKEHQDISGKQDAIQDLSAIRSGAAAGATAYQKPLTGIPATDLESSVQTSLNKANSAQQPATTLAGYGITDGYTKTEGAALEAEVDQRLDDQDDAISRLNGNDVVVVDSLDDVTTPDTQKIYRVPNHTEEIDVEGDSNALIGNDYYSYLALTLENNTEYVALDGCTFINLQNSTIIGTTLTTTIVGSEQYAVAKQVAGASDVADLSYTKTNNDVTPTKYTDWMCTDNTTTPVTWKKIATYRFPGIDDKPTPESNKLVKSGGVADMYGSYTENPEYVYVKTDNEGKILYGVKIDGEFFFGAGCPQQIKKYIEERLSDISFDEYENIVAFLTDYLDSDTTLKTIIDEINEQIETKVDQEEGKSLIDSEYASTVRSIENPEYLLLFVDNEDKIVFGLRADGKTYVADADFLNNIKNNQEAINNINLALASINSSIELLDINALSSIVEVENPEFIEVKADAEGKIIAFRTPDGVKHETVGIDVDTATINHLKLTGEGMTEFQRALKESGFMPGGVGDWSDSKSIELPIPRCAIANITNDTNDAVWPIAKGVDLQYYLEFWDMQGNYFKKEIIFNAQGNSSMMFVKKNGAADFCNNNGWDDDDTFSIKFGDWVAQDSFHFKAYYTDYIKGSCPVAYQISEDVYKTRGVYADVPWKKALIDFSKIGATTPAELSQDGVKDTSLQIDNGARCMPDGFPCIFYLNGEFYGIYSWQLKKHRDNYHFNKALPEHIQLDGTLYIANLWGGSINWTQFEIRNPKNLVYATAHGGSYKYDADVSEDEIAGNSDGSLVYDDWVAGSYLVDKIVKHGSHYYINTVPDNTAEPVYNKKNNGDDAPDFKNKTGCGWINCTNTIKVKNYIINLSKRVGEINILNATDSVAAKELFDTYFDADNLIDYQLIGMAVNDPDGFGKNWQWITYDGIKWYVCQYDKDMSFGNHWTGMFTRPVPPGGWASSEVYTPLGIALRYYRDEHIARWKELVQLGIFTADFFERKINEWVARIGQNNFKKEWEKWSNAPCNRDSLIDFENWRFTGGYAAATPNGNIWNEETSYTVGQYVWFRCGNSSEYLQFCAYQNNIGKPCLTGLYQDYPISMGYRDSVWRYFKFIEANLEAQNNFINSFNI